MQRLTEQRANRCPIGATVTLDQLDREPHAVAARLRPSEPVSWVPVLDGWLVTGRELVIEMMRDAATYTVDDPRFSTAQVLGPSMLSLDGAAHARHRDPFADSFRLPAVRRRFAAEVERLAADAVDRLSGAGRADLRSGLAGPLAVEVMIVALDLAGVEADEVLGWYREIVGAVSERSIDAASESPLPDALDLLDDHVGAAISRGRGLLAAASGSLSATEVTSNAGVLLFGGVETSEGMTTNLFAHLLDTPGAWVRLVAEPALAPNAIEESLRLEPAATRIDRFATRTVDVGGVRIERGDLVVLSLAAANRDPSTFPDPDRFDLVRANARQQVAFAHGPHACLGIHLAKLETQAALLAALARWPELRRDPELPPAPVSGLVFRKPDTLHVVW